MIYGYARVSRKTQDIRRQLMNITEQFPDAKIYQEAHTGAKLEGRDELDKLLRRVKTGDTIVFDSASRMSRNADEAMELYEKLFRNGINLVFLNEPHINTEVYKKSLDSQISLHVNTGSSAQDKLIQTIVEALNQYALDLAKEQIRRVFEQAQKELEDNHSRVKRGLKVRIDRNAELKAEDPEHYMEHEDYTQIGHEAGDTYTTQKSKDLKPRILKKSKTFGGTMNDSELAKYLGISRTTVIKYKKELLEEQTHSAVNA